MILKTVDITKVIGKKTILKNINMNINKGDIYGLIGSNGAGKTMLMRIISTLVNATEGNIYLFDNKNYKKELYRVGTTIEFPTLYKHLTAKENIKLQMIQLNINDKSDVQIDKHLERLGLSPVKNDKVKTFSMGMRQKLMIATVLVGNPEFLILDEPMNGLDPVAVKSLWEFLLKLNREYGITILLSSHIIGELGKIATKFGFIRNGILTKEIEHSEIDIELEEYVIQLIASCIL